MMKGYLGLYHSPPSGFIAFFLFPHTNISGIGYCHAIFRVAISPPNAEADQNRYHYKEAFNNCILPIIHSP